MICSVIIYVYMSRKKLSMTRNIENMPSRRRVIWGIWKWLRPFPGAILIMILASLCGAIDSSLRPYLLKILVDQVSGPTSDDIFTQVYYPAVGLILLSIILSVVFRLYGYFVEIKMIPLLRTNIAHRTFGVLLGQGYRFFQNNPAGSLANKTSDLTKDIPELVQIFFDHYLRFFLSLLIAFYALAQVHMQFFMILFMWSMSIIVLVLVVNRNLENLIEEWSAYTTRITGELSDVLFSSLAVRLFARQKSEQLGLYHFLNKATKAERKIQWSYFWIRSIAGLFFILSLIGNLYFLILARQDGLITSGDFVFVLLINAKIGNFLFEIIKDTAQFSKLYGRIAKAFKILYYAPFVSKEPLGAKALIVSPQKGGIIIFQKVQFQSAGLESFTQNIPITIYSGQKVGLVGYAGSGKTTFMNLILRLYEVQSGEILIDGQDISTVTQDSLRAAISMIPKDPTLFHRSLRENIRYGRPDATDEEVEEAAKKAHINGFITRLPTGYSSIVGEKETRLLVGQRQRIAMARAFLKDAPILIIDEASTILDSVTERDMQDSLLKLMQGKTSIVVAHRLFTLRRMDRILVFDQGKIVEEGTHEALLGRAGLYKKLWDSEIGGFIPDLMPEYDG